MSVNDSLHREDAFERYLSRSIAGLEGENGWRVSPDDTGFDPQTALYMPDFIEFQERVAPEKLEKMRASMGGNWENNLRMQLVTALRDDGTIDVIRHGFKMAGYQTIMGSAPYPADKRIRNAQVDYEANILRVMHQVHYQTQGNKSLDLVFFINGIPVATAEVKTELTQTVQDAIEEYQTERKPIEPGTNRRNWLLMYKSGAVVHFAISEDEVWMCTNLEADVPRFLPFNKGTADGHAGNPPAEDGGYRTSYFWKEICQRDNWLHIFQNFVFEETSRKEDATGRMRTRCTQIFPRYHQWDAVTKMIADVRANGAGQRYLIEHSAGSGKTETITWTAHELADVRQDNGERLFSSVVVVTDRLSLDTNIKKTIGQLRNAPGYVMDIGTDSEGRRTSDAAKSRQLAKALGDRREIIVVTLQTFLYAWPMIAADPRLTGRDFAVIIDEAHSSQEGSSAAALKSAFSLDSSALSGAAGGMDLSSLDLSGLDLDLSGVGKDIDFSDIMAKAPAPDFSGIFDGLELTPEQMQQVGTLANQLFEGFLQSDQFKALSPEDLKDASKLAAAFSAYLENDAAAQQCLAQLKALGGDALAERLQQVMGDYVQKQLAPYLQQSMDQVMKAVSEQIATTVSTQLKAGAAGLTDQMATQMSSSFANLASAMRVDANAFARAIHFNMDVEDLSSLMMSYAKASKLTYDNNLTTLGYADEADPISVKIFPRDFEAKERALDHIDAYNKQVKAAGHDEQAISYTDYMGIIMGSVTDIVNTISLVLIAFVSISLVVSSIMIGIITYGSGLERKKEIGILRAIGASKRNVANVFNAETFIEGLIAGVFAIVVVVAVSFPVNAWALAAKQVPNLMSLPVQDALMLIVISVLLTVVAGLLPARSASKKDPVEALRSE